MVQCLPVSAINNPILLTSDRSFFGGDAGFFLYIASLYHLTLPRGKLILFTLFQLIYRNSILRMDLLLLQQMPCTLSNVPGLFFPFPFLNDESVYSLQTTVFPCILNLRIICRMELDVLER